MGAPQVSVAISVKVCHRIGEFADGRTPVIEAVAVDEHIIATLAGAMLALPDDDPTDPVTQLIQGILPGQYVSGTTELEEVGMTSILQFAYETTIIPVLRDAPVDFTPNRIFVTTDTCDDDPIGPDLIAERGTTLAPDDC